MNPNFGESGPAPGTQTESPFGADADIVDAVLIGEDGSEIPNVAPAAPEGASAVDSLPSESSAAEILKAIQAIKGPDATPTEAPQTQPSRRPRIFGGGRKGPTEETPPATPNAFLTPQQEQAEAAVKLAELRDKLF